MTFSLLSFETKWTTDMANQPRCFSFRFVMAVACCLSVTLPATVCEAESKLRMDRPLIEQQVLVLREIETLIYRADSPAEVDPQRALELYQRFYDELENASWPDDAIVRKYDADSMLLVLNNAAKVKPFDITQFAKTYDIDLEEERRKPYGIWRLAEEASKGGRFGPPNPELALQLVVRGASVPSEWDFALEMIYPVWEKGEPFTFDLCQYVMSAWGTRFCDNRQEALRAVEIKEQLDSYKRRLEPDQAHLIDDLYESVMTYVQHKSEHEEGHSGGFGWRQRHMHSSEVGRREHFLSMLEKMMNGERPFTSAKIQDTSAALEPLLKDFKIVIPAHLEEAELYMISLEGVELTQEKWLVFRSNVQSLVTEVASSELADAWCAYFTDERVKDLESTRSAVEGKGFIK